MNLKYWEWASVDDAMPNIGESLLVMIKRLSPDSRQSGLDVQQCYNDGGGNPIWAKGWRKGDRFEITHWMRVKPPSDS